MFLIHMMQKKYLLKKTMSDGMGNSIVLSKKEIMDYLNMRPPYLFVDEVEVIPGVSANGYRDFPADEWFFDCHFVDDPIVPGVFQLELMMQTSVMAIHTISGVSAGIIYGRKFVNVDCISPVSPGERLFAETEIISFKRGCAVAKGITFVYRDDKKIITSKSEFQMVSPKIMSDLLPSSKG